LSIDEFSALLQAKLKKCIQWFKFALCKLEVFLIGVTTTIKINLPIKIHQAEKISIFEH